MKKPLMLLLFAACLATAQTTTTYVMPSGQFHCMTSFRVPTSFYDFSCNINFQEQNGPGTGEMIGTNVLFFNPVGFGINAGSPPSYVMRISKVLQDVAPANGQPGQFTWEWEVETQDGIFHVGVMTGTWERGICGRGGCPVALLEVSTTVDSEPVEIFF